MLRPFDQGFKVAIMRAAVVQRAAKLSTITIAKEPHANIELKNHDTLFPWSTWLMACIMGECTLGSRGYFFLIDTVRDEAGLTRKKITSGHRSRQPHFHVRNQFRILIGYFHVKLFDVVNQGHYYIVNSLRTWEYPIGDPVQILNWFVTWKWGCLLLWPEVIFFLVNPASPRTSSIDKKKISSGAQGINQLISILKQ